MAPSCGGVGACLDGLSSFMAHLVEKYLYNDKMRVDELIIMLLPFFLYNGRVIKYSVSRL